MSSTATGALPPEGCFGTAPYPGNRIFNRQGPNIAGKQQRAGFNAAEDMQVNSGYTTRHRCDMMCISTRASNTAYYSDNMKIQSRCHLQANNSQLSLSVCNKEVIVYADALLNAMSVALDCETVCVSLLTSNRTIISNGTGLMQPKMSFPTGVCHWSLVPQDAQTIIVEDMLEDER